MQAARSGFSLLAGVLKGIYIVNKLAEVDLLFHSAARNGFSPLAGFRYTHRIVRVALKSAIGLKLIKNGEFYFRFKYSVTMAVEPWGSHVWHEDSFDNRGTLYLRRPLYKAVYCLA